MSDMDVVVAGTISSGDCRRRATSPYTDPRAHARVTATRSVGGPRSRCRVESIAEDLLGLRTEERELEHTAHAPRPSDDRTERRGEPVHQTRRGRRHRFHDRARTRALGGHRLEGRATNPRRRAIAASIDSRANDADRAIEREANISARVSR